VKTRFGRDLSRGVAIACVLALLVAGALWWVLSAANGKRVTAYFTETVGLYPGSTVRMLGIDIGSVDSVTPMPNRVKVDMTVDRQVDIPADTHAVIVLPALVSDRYVAFDKYTGGPELQDGSVIPLSRTQPPAEVDQLYRSLTNLSHSLGPNGANSHGALSDLLNTGAANLKGNGKALHQTITRLGKVARTLNGNQKDLFLTVDNLAKFTTTLQRSDAKVRDFTNRVTDVTGFLADERGKLGTVLSELGTTLDKVQSFVNGSHKALKSNVDNLASVTQVLVKDRAALAETLDVAPLALDNLYNTYNASSGTLDARMDLNELNNPPIVTVCKLIRQVNPSTIPQVLANACGSLAKIIHGFVTLPSVPDIITALEKGKLPQLPPSALSTILDSARGGDGQ
jgi:virulence factor Mce-like protein